jgi:hypothetical protein
MRSPVADLLGDLAGAMDAQGIPWYVFGARAAILYGAARLTADVDVTISLSDPGSYPSLIATLTAHGFRLRTTDPEFTARTRVIPLTHTPTGLPADLVLAGSGLEDRFFGRVTIHDLDGLRVPIASAEDIIIMKVLAGRAKDMDDVAAIAASQVGVLDARYIRQTLRELDEALTRDDLLTAFEEALARSRKK